MSIDLVQEVSNEINTPEIIHCDQPDDAFCS
jgi:hypothetical protein